MRFPILIKLPPLASFEWKQVNAVDNPDGLDNKNKDQPPGQLWAPDAIKQGHSSLFHASLPSQQ